MGDISERIDRGKHTTRACSLIPVNGGAVLDTPGFSLLESALIDPITLQDYYPEFEPYGKECRFRPCCHESEPDCAVKAQLAAGHLPRERYERYLELLHEMKERWAKRYD